AQAFEGAGRAADGSVTALYRGEAGNKLADVLRSLVGSTARLKIAPADWPDVLAALIDGETVKPRHAREGSVSIWGALEARLLHVDLIICGGLNEGTWPVRTDPGGFMSRMMKTDLDLDPPERRIGQAAHDFMMAMGQPQVVLTRAMRTADAPSVPSRWVQRLTAFVGKDATGGMRKRGDALLAAARHYAGDTPEPVPFATRPDQKPPVEARPKHFSVTEIETLRRDPYAIYARKVLRLAALDELLRDPGASERGSLFHDILHAFTLDGVDAGAPDALDRLLAIARKLFDEEELPPDVDAVWWPRFKLMAPNLIAWEQMRSAGKSRSFSEASASATVVGTTGVTLAGRADRIDVMHGGVADILDYKTGTSPSKSQAHTLLVPQLALEGALLMRDAFSELGALTPGELAYVRLRASGAVDEESILEIKGAKKSLKSAAELSEEAWGKLDRLLTLYNEEAKGYLSRALPFREGDTDGDYDHLARVHEWSAGGEAGDEGGEE
ncbi:MAG: double-strand break repair protein AddB, partial [Mesorhizobium sp.]